MFEAEDEIGGGTRKKEVPSSDETKKPGLRTWGGGATWKKTKHVKSKSLGRGD